MNTDGASLATAVFMGSRFRGNDNGRGGYCGTLS